MRKALIALITLYQRTLSPDHGLLKSLHPAGYCRFRPTCSEYTKEALMEYGSLKGSWLGILRICKCHPWRQITYDPLKLNR